MSPPDRSQGRVARVEVHPFESRTLTDREFLTGSAGGRPALIAGEPDCMTTYREELDVADEPIRIFHGSADDYDPIAPCRAYVERLREAGEDVQLTEYAGARHVFDWEMLETPQRWPRAQTTRRCRLEEADDGRIVNAETRETFTYDDPCVERGVTVAYDADAHRDARRAMMELVTAVLRPG